MAKVNWIWRETAEIIGVLGVIGSLVFVAFEIRQNNELLAANARAYRHEIRSQNSNRQFLENPELAALKVKVDNGVPLREVEQFTVERYFNQILLDFQFSFVEYERGQFGEEDLNIATMRNTFFRKTGMSSFWSEYSKVYFRPDFAQWMNENIVTQEHKSNQ